MKHISSIPKKSITILKKNKVWILLIAVGLLFIGLSTLQGGEKEAVQSDQDFCNNYVNELEKKLEEIVCDVAEIKECNIMITLKSGIEYIYATDTDSQDGEQNSQNEEKITVVTDKQTGEKAVVITEVYPQVNGVSIICHAPNTASLTLAIKNAAATALGIDQSKVCVILKG